MAFNTFFYFYLFFNNKKQNKKKKAFKITLFNLNLGKDNENKKVLIFYKLKS